VGITVRYTEYTYTAYRVITVRYTEYTYTAYRMIQEKNGKYFERSFKNFFILCIEPTNAKLIDKKPTTAENTSTSTFIRKPEAATAV